MDQKDQKQVKLNSILTLFKHLIRNVSASDDFDYHSDPVDSHTYWNYINPDSVRVVYNLNGNGAPEIDTHHWYDQKGIVITFDSSLGGNCQIFLNRHVLALRQIGNPAGWSYLGLDDNDKLYVDEDTLHILHNITDHAYHHNAVTLDTNQSIHGQKDFTILPLYNGQPLVYHSEFHKLVSYVRMNDKHLSDLDNQYELLSNTANDTTSLVNDFKSKANDTYATKSDLNNYVPTNQLRYYVTQKQFDDALGNYGIRGIKETIHRMNIRAEDNYNSEAASLNSSLSTGFAKISSAVSTNASRANSADVRFSRINQHNKKQDKIVHDLESHAASASSSNLASLSNSVSKNASAVSSNTAELSNVKAHFKRMNKRNTDFAQSASSAITSLDSKVNHLYAENSQDAQDYYNQAEADESNDVSSLAGELKAIKTALGARS